MSVELKNRPVLIVEDNPDEAELAVLAMREKGINLPYHIVSDGQEAIDYLLGDNTQYPTELYHMPRIILLDLKLPRKGGIDVLKTLRSYEHTRYIPVIVLTTSSLDDDIKRCYEAGANSYIRKPVDFHSFCYYIELIFRYWTEVNCQPAIKIELQRMNG